MDSSTIQRMANSRNHLKKGQNVLYADGHVTFVTTAFAGYNNDNIYTYSFAPNNANPWTTGAEMPYPDTLLNPNDSMMQPNEGDLLNANGGTGIN